MQIGTVLLIILSAIAALAIVFYQYYFNSKGSNNLRLPLAFLRFISLFCCFLLLVNPKFTKNEYTLEKANLVLLLDNSSSLNGTSESTQLASIRQTLKSSAAIEDNFSFRALSFGQYLNATDSLTSDEKATNISTALASINDIYTSGNTAVILATDGNQTLGDDYEYYAGIQEIPVFPVVVGDTTSYADLRIEQVNLNRYAFLSNRFPIEVYAAYQGSGLAKSTLRISLNGRIVHSTQLDFSSDIKSAVVNTLISANSIGIKELKIELTPLEGERNLANNQRLTAIEVIDEKTDIAIISEILHPDLGTLKKAIESNEQRAVRILKPQTPLNQLEEVDIFILYQPRTSFRAIMEYIDDRQAAKFTITGSKTDWTFLNGIQSSFNKTSYNQTEEIFPVLNTGFGNFDVSGFSILDFPPLEGYLGEILITRTFENILEQQIKGVIIDEPLLSVIGNRQEREAALFAENIWKWRAQTYKNEKSFKNFDALLSKIILYLSSNSPKSRLSLDYQTTYEGLGDATITATYFDETFVFDGDASINLKLQQQENQTLREIPMLLMNGYYKADLSNLPPGQYNFTAEVADMNISKSGTFRMLDFDVEKQFYSSNYRKLDRLATITKAGLYYPGELENLIETLVTDPQFIPTQKSNQNVVSLVDFRLLLGIIISALAAEWFIRKYNGLI